MPLRAVLLASLATASALQLRALPPRCLERRACAVLTISGSEDDDTGPNDDDALSESLGARQEAGKLDAADDSDELLASLRSRLDAEGGETMFKLKTDAKRVASDVQGGAEKVRAAGDDAIDAVKGATAAMNPNTLRLFGVVLFLTFLPGILQGIGAYVNGPGAY